MLESATSGPKHLAKPSDFDWVKLHRAGKVTGAIGKSAVTAEQMEISRLRAELARVDDGTRHPGKSDGILRKGPEVNYAFIQVQSGSGRSGCNAEFSA